MKKIHIDLSNSTSETVQLSSSPRNNLRRNTAFLGVAVAACCSPLRRARGSVFVIAMKITTSITAESDIDPQAILGDPAAPTSIA